MSIELERNDLDRQIWEEELDPFLPQRIFDVHTHVFKWEFDTNPPSQSPFYVEARRGFPSWDMMPSRPRTPFCSLDGASAV